MKDEGLKRQRKNSLNDDKNSEDLLKEGNKINIDDLLKRIKTSSSVEAGKVVSLGEASFLNFQAFLGGVAPKAKPMADLEDISEYFKSEFESLPFVYLEYVESIMLVNRIPELMHVYFWNICSDEKCRVA
ncbi:hypothetical protein Tco_0646623 [Tanacetum coccineum]